MAAARFEVFSVTKAKYLFEDETQEMRVKRLANTPSVQLLIDRDNEQNLPLHLAIENAHIDMLRFIVQFCADKGEARGLSIYRYGF